MVSLLEGTGVFCTVSNLFRFLQYSSMHTLSCMPTIHSLSPYMYLRPVPSSISLPGHHLIPLGRKRWRPHQPLGGSGNRPFAQRQRRTGSSQWRSEPTLLGGHQQRRGPQRSTTGRRGRQRPQHGQRRWRERGRRRRLLGGVDPGRRRREEFQTARRPRMVAGCGGKVGPCPCR